MLSALSAGPPSVVPGTTEGPIDSHNKIIQYAFMMSDYEKYLNTGLQFIKPYVPGKSIQEVMREKGISQIVKMASNENPYGISPKAAAAIREAADLSFRYPEVTCFDLREKLKDFLKLPAASIIIGNGADGIIYTLGLSLLNEGDEVIIPEITFSMYEIISQVMRAKIVYTRLKKDENYAIDLEHILAQITPRTKLIWLCNPNNPIGTMIDRQTFNDFMAQVPENVIVVHDEVYFDFADQERFPDTLAMLRAGRKNLFIMRSFSKIYGLAGVRVGYGAGPEQLVNVMYKVRPPFEVSVLGQAAASGALDDLDFYKKSLELVKAEKKFIYHAIEKLGLSYIPSHTNFILIGTGQDGTHVYEELLAQGIIVRPLKSYNLPQHIRLTIGQRSDNERFINALQKIANNR